MLTMTNDIRFVYTTWTI